MANGPLWAAEEDATLRASYASGGILAAVAALPGRTRDGIEHRVRLLGLRRQWRWTAEEDARLTKLWDEYSIHEIAKLLGRTTPSVYFHAVYKLGLSSGCPEGWEYVKAAAKRTGYDQRQLMPILRAAGVQVRPVLSNPMTPKTDRRRCLVDPLDVDEAVAEWNKREPVRTAAMRLGVHPDTLRIRLRKAGFAPKRIGRGRPRAGLHWRVSDEEVAKAMEGYVWHRRTPEERVEEARRHDRRRGSAAPSPSAGLAAEARGSAAVGDPAEAVTTGSLAVEPRPARLGGRAPDHREAA